MAYFKRLKLQPSDRTVWVFGAGASAADPYKIPEQSKLLSRLANMRRPRGKKLQKEFRELRERVRKHCKRVQPGLEMESPTLSLEEVFSAYELALTEPRSTPRERQEAEEAIRDLRDGVRLAVYVYGSGSALKWKPFSRNRPDSPYAKLLEVLFRKKTKTSVDHAFITFNYDICLDRCAINLRRERCIDVDYAIPLSNHRYPLAAPPFDPPRQDKSIVVLRTHGALNWLRCRACESVFTTVNSHAAVAKGSVWACWACGHAPLEYVMVHPSFLRSYSDPIIRLVWGRCEEELVRANRWVFVGYSLPAADVHFREMLRCALRQREGDKRKTDIVFAGRDDLRFKEVVEAYRVMFPRQLRVWDATKSGFSDFVHSIDA